MGRVSVSLSLSSADVLSSPVALDLKSFLSADSGNIQRVKVNGTLSAGTAQTVYKANDKTSGAYLYVRNLQTTDTDTVTIFEAGNNVAIAVLKGGEFMFLPVSLGVTLEAKVSTQDDLIEYGVFGSDSSAVRYS
tara:strand:- start:1732 stop:2133 length:402 start_codon:yes stop_codon:yes gene_type:complete